MQQRNVVEGTAGSFAKNLGPDGSASLSSPQLVPNERAVDAKAFAPDASDEVRGRRKMLKFLAVPMVAAMLGFGSGQALAFPTQNTGLAQQNFSNVTTVASGQRELWWSTVL